MDNRRNATKDCWVDTGRGRLFVRCWPAPHHADAPDSVPPIVLLHDSLGCVHQWRTFPNALAECTGRRVIAYDRLGFGQSDPRTDALDADFVRDEARRFFPMLRDQLGFDRFVAFGHSVGGGMAVHCAAAHPSACEALITESAQAFVEDRTRAGIVDAREQFKQRETFERLQVYHGEKTRWVLDAWIETWLSPAFSDWSLNDVLPQVRCPTLAIHGSDDEYGSNLHPETIVRSVGGPAQIEIVPGVRHVPHRERERWVAERVAGFIGANRRESTRIDATLTNRLRADRAFRGERQRRPAAAFADRRIGGSADRRIGGSANRQIGKSARRTMKPRSNRWT